MLLPLRHWRLDTTSCELAGLISPYLNAVMEPVISITAPTPTDFKPNVHGHIYRTTTFFADAALFDMVRRFTSLHAEFSHTQKHVPCRMER